MLAVLACWLNQFYLGSAVILTMFLIVGKKKQSFSLVPLAQKLPRRRTVGEPDNVSASEG